MAVAGYSLLVRRSGTSTSASAEACSQVTGETYRITAAAKRCIDPEQPWHLKDGAATIAFTGIAAMDFLNGQFTLASSPGGSVTFNGNYLPLTTSDEIVAGARDFTLSESTNLHDTTAFAGTTSLHAAVRSRTTGLRDATLSVESIAEDSALSALEDAKNAGSTVVAEVYFGDVTYPRFRGLVKVESIERSANANDDLNVTNLSFSISAVRHVESGFLASYTYAVQP